jgi:hypothetical protein
LIEKEIGKREICEGAAIPEQPEQPVVPGVEPALDVVQELASDLEGLSSCNPGRLLVDLDGLVERVRVARAGADGSQTAAPSDRAEARYRLPTGNPERCVGVSDAGPVEGPAHNGDLVVPDEHFVDERGAEDAVPIDRHVAKRRIGEAAEEQWKRPFIVLGFVSCERNASKHFVVRRRAPVDAHVPLVRISRRQRVADEVAGDAAHISIGKRIERGISQDGARDRADTARRDLVTREGLSRQRVANGCADARQIAAAPGIGCDRNGLGSRGIETRALVVTKEEQLALDERAAERAAEDVLPALRLGRARAVVRP